MCLNVSQWSPALADVDGYQAPEDDLVTLRARTISGSFYIGAGQVLRILISLASQIILGRLLLPADFGLVAMTAPVISFLELFKDLGLSQAVVTREEFTTRDLNALYWLGIALSVACALVLAAVSPIVAGLYREPQVCPIMIALAAQMPLASLGGHASALMARRMKYAAIAVVEVVAAGVTLITAVLSVWLGARYWGLVIGVACGAITRAVLDLWLSGWRPGPPAWTENTRGLIGFGGQLTMSSFLGYCTYYFDNIAVGALFGPATLGLFDRSFSLVLRPLSSVTAPISRVAIPLLARSRADAESYRSSYSALLKGLVGLGTPGLIVLSLSSRDVISFLLGANWLGMTTMFSAICVAAIFTPLSGSSAWLFVSQERPGEQVKIGLISSLMIIVGMVAGLPFGANGVAIAYALIAPFVHGCYSWAAARKGPVSRLDIVRTLAPTFATSLLIVMATLVLQRALSGQQVLVRLGVTGFVAYLIEGTVFVASPSGRRQILAVYGLVRRRPAPS